MIGIILGHGHGIINSLLYTNWNRMFLISISLRIIQLISSALFAMAKRATSNTQFHYNRI